MPLLKIFTVSCYPHHPLESPVLCVTDIFGITEQGVDECVSKMCLSQHAILNAIQMT